MNQTFPVSPALLACPSDIRFAKRKNLHLLWMTRDGGMVALFEKQVWM